MAKRSIKSRAKSKVQRELRSQFKGSLTPNQQEFLKQTRRLEREIKQVAKRIEHPLTEDDILSLLPVNPKVITKKYLKKLAKQTAKELLASLMGENPIAREVAEKVVDVVAENVTPADDENVSHETQDEIPVNDRTMIGIVQTIADRILSLPDFIEFYDKRMHTWLRYPLEDDKEALLDLFSYRDWYALTEEEQETIYNRLMRHQGGIFAGLEHLPRASTQSDYSDTYGAVASLLTSDILDKDLATITSNLSEKLGVY